MRAPIRRNDLLGLFALLTCAVPAQNASWAHLQISGVVKQTCTITLTLGSEVFVLENIPAETTASDIARDLAREINSARHGHIYHAATNGVDDSILSIIADGSPTQSTTPWLGRLVPNPRVDIDPNPNAAGIQIQKTDLQNTLVAIAVEGEQTTATSGTISIKLNGRTLSLELNEGDAGGAARRADTICTDLSNMINADPGFRSSVLRDDTGQLMIFVTGENMGGGIQLQEGPTDIAGLKFRKSNVLFASTPLMAVNSRER
jgi:phage tail sheath gpL-like